MQPQGGNIDVSAEVKFQTTRSGGKGGQNVNKVETAVIAYWDVAASVLLSEEQKVLVQEKLSNRINQKGELLVRSQTHRTQQANKDESLEKLNALINQALTKKKSRIAVKVPKKVKEKILKEKKNRSEIKSGRKRLRPGDF